MNTQTEDKALSLETTYDLASLPTVYIDETCIPEALTESEKNDKRFDIIVKAVLSRYYYKNVTELQLFAHGRKGEVVFCRHMVMYLTKELTELGLSAIGRKFKGRADGTKLDHSTVINGIRKIGDRIDVEKGFKDKLETFKKEVEWKLQELK